MVSALIVAGVAIVAALFYVAECIVWPFRPCPRCKGAGRHMAPWGSRAWRSCRRCRGTGARLRIGRRIWNLYRRLKAS